MNISTHTPLVALIATLMCIGVEVGNIAKHGELSTDLRASIALVQNN